MRILWAAICALFLSSAAAMAQTATADLAQPPADAQNWTILSTAGPHGHSHRWTAPDGVRWSRETLVLRGFATEIDQQLRFGADGGLIGQEVRGSTPSGDAGEHYAVADRRYEYTSQVDHGDGAYQAGQYYAAVGGTIDATAAFVDALRAAPDHTLNLLPSGQARLEPLTTADVSNGQEQKTLTAYVIIGVSLSPFAVWYDGDSFFGTAGFLSWMPVGWESAAISLTRAQEAALSARSASVAERIGPRPAGPVAFGNVRIYDSEQRRFRDSMTVIVENGRIGAVGRASRVAVPAGATVIDGAGRTLVPGLWDNHQHYNNDDTGPLLLSQGITSVRDPGNNPETSPQRRARIERGEILGTRIVPSLLIDGVGPNAAQVAVPVTSQEEAIAAVQRAHNEGYFGVKLYGSLNPEWLPAMAQEAHRLGLRVHGHIPQGLRPLQAVRDGYDEITHINWVMMQAVPDDVIGQSSGLQRFYGPALYGPDADLDGPVMGAYLDELRRRGVAVDPTISTFEPLYLPEPGEMPADYAPFVGTLPPALERSLRSGGLTPTPEVSREQMRRGFASLVALIGELHRRGITIVAGTDGFGLELVRELELYVDAGMSPAEALATATIVPAQQFGVGAETGSITTGKLAELTLVQGDPSRSIGDLRNVVMVMRDGRLMQADQLRAAAGISGPPHAP